MEAIALGRMAILAVKWRRSCPVDAPIAVRGMARLAYFDGQGSARLRNLRIQNSHPNADWSQSVAVAARLQSNLFALVG